MESSFSLAIPLRQTHPLSASFSVNHVRRKGGNSIGSGTPSLFPLISLTYFLLTLKNNHQAEIIPDISIVLLLLQVKLGRERSTEP